MSFLKGFLYALFVVIGVATLVLSSYTPLQKAIVLAPILSGLVGAVFGWPRRIDAGIFFGAVLGPLGWIVVWAVGQLKEEET